MYSLKSFTCHDNISSTMVDIRAYYSKVLWTIVIRVMNEEISSYKQGCLSFLFLLWCQINAGNFWRSYKWKCMMYFSDMIAQNITAPFTLSQRHDHERRFYENIHICHIFHCNRDHLCCNHIYFISSFGKIQSSLVNGDLWFLKVIWSKVLNLKHLSP